MRNIILPEEVKVFRYQGTRILLPAEEGQITRAASAYTLLNRLLASRLKLLEAELGVQLIEFVYSLNSPVFEPGC